MSNAKSKSRLDVLLTARGLAPSREKAQALILAGQVLVNHQKILKAGHSVDDGCVIEMLGQTKYVGRGGLKLEAALDHWHLTPTGWVAMDVGASTGGFTDCLLQRGAARVHAVDVGKTQLAWGVRSDARVVIHEECNARFLTPGDIGEPVQLIVCDVSFISVTMILPALAAFRARMLILVKPQFEVGREQVGKGGIVRDPALHEMACEKVAQAVRQLAFTQNVFPCPVRGAEGNQEFWLLAEPEP
ncbi:MAG: TlyA family RNA methyltransferase [Bryobacteraceae bacterium]|nr:TlyA family RNA methyltransferase [Bryobacteraceae bacterium]